ncbi:hypothetical protein FX988_03752 [Paraglaciecola mesophila]|uniref:MaoC-like domain-containing protein n=1 Tax=Paraglaciecola mesophila TaxID=197222 RepID=A0A857JQW9_9ALTE|nr:MaoC/PaaZ C-terminal domain-containing protein [Paraglaciecola mesophila]QHJ13491.1 hypothetical protein FX988_03752 [Paraglaciecola mesophila]
MINSVNALPSFASIMFRAALKRDNHAQFPPTFDRLPHKSFLFTAANLAHFSKAKIERFHSVTHWQGTFLHPCYLHVVSFPLHMMLMLEKEFPFSLLGLVHIHNEITQYRPIRANEGCVFHCYFKDMKAHPKGVVFSIATDVRVNEELCWSSVSTNLYRDATLSAPEGKAQGASPNAQDECPQDECHYTGQKQESWYLGENVGRKYAQASGDFNPIHLTRVTAKLFGFKQAIAHGMWSKSRCLSAIEQAAPEIFEQSFNTQVQFIKPAMLPSNVQFTMCENSAETTQQNLATRRAFSLTSKAKHGANSSPHLSGELIAF